MQFRSFINLRTGTMPANDLVFIRQSYQRVCMFFTIIRNLRGYTMFSTAHFCAAAPQHAKFIHWKHFWSGPVLTRCFNKNWVQDHIAVVQNSGKSYPSPIWEEQITGPCDQSEDQRTRTLLQSAIGLKSQSTRPVNRTLQKTRASIEYSNRFAMPTTPMQRP